MLNHCSVNFNHSFPFNCSLISFEVTTLPHQFTTTVSSLNLLTYYNVCSFNFVYKISIKMVALQRQSNSLTRFCWNLKLWVPPKVEKQLLRWIPNPLSRPIFKLTAVDPAFASKLPTWAFAIFIKIKSNRGLEGQQPLFNFFLD